MDKEKDLFEGWPQRNLSRRGFLTAGAAAAFLAACGKTEVGGPQTARPSGAASGAVSEELESELSIYNWADYVHPKTYPAFQKEFDVKITEDNYPSNEDALAKLKAGASGYDIVAPTGYMVEIMIAEGLLMELDHSKIPNLSTISPQFADLPF